MRDSVGGAKPACGFLRGWCFILFDVTLKNESFAEPCVNKSFY